MGTYRIDRSYDWNYEHGPIYNGPYPRVPKTRTKDFFGVPVRSRVGIAAGLLLNSKWIKLYARLGFDILTYKTVRTVHRKCQRMPNWVYIDRTDPVGAPDEVLRRVTRRPRNGREVTSSVSFGMPSKAPEVWQKDVARARKALKPGQALVVSVVASPGSGDGPEIMVEDYARLTALAREAGAQVIEANLSCPNVCTAEGSVYLDPTLTKRVARAMQVEAKGVPTTIKGGFFQSTSLLKRFLRAVAGHVDGVVLVNGVSRRVVNPDGSPAFGPGRETVGVLGRGIHGPCLRNVRGAVDIVERDRLGLRVMAVGGVLAPEDAQDYFDAGAYAVMMGGGPMFQPMLAVQFKKAHPEW